MGISMNRHFIDIHHKIFFPSVSNMIIITCHSLSVSFKGEQMGSIKIYMPYRTLLKPLLYPTFTLIFHVYMLYVDWRNVHWANVSRCGLFSELKGLSKGLNPLMKHCCSHFNMLKTTCSIEKCEKGFFVGSDKMLSKFHFIKGLKET